MNSVVGTGSGKTPPNHSSSEQGSGIRGSDGQEGVHTFATANITVQGKEHWVGSISGRGRDQELGTKNNGEGDVPSNTEQRRVIHIEPSLVYDLKLTRDVIQEPSSGPPCRPDFGTCGHTVRLRANHFRVHSIPDALYEYHVQIAPGGVLLSNMKARRRVYQLAEQTTTWEKAGMVGTVTHDGASRLISSGPLPHPLEIQVQYHEEGTPLPQPNVRLCVLTITFVRILDMGNLIGYIQGRPGFRSHNIYPVLSALNLIQLAARGTSFQQSRLFFIENTAITLGGGIEARRGFTMALHPARGHLTIRVNIRTMPVYIPGNLATSIATFQSFAGPGFPADRFVRNIKVAVTHVGSRKIVRKLSDQNSDTHTVETPEVGQVTVRDFFSLRYGIQLKFPYMRLVEFGSPLGSRLPPEMCMILADQPFRGNLLHAHAIAMTNIARVSPNTNGQMVQHIGKQPVGRILQQFGTTVDPEALEVLGRVLPKPTVIYSTKTADVNNRAQWSPGDAKFVVGTHIDRWVVLVLRDNHYGSEFTGVTDQKLKEAVSIFRDMCNCKGMNITRDPSYTVVQLPPATAADPMRELATTYIRAVLAREKPKPQAVLIVLASSEGPVYQGVKYLCDVLLDVTTICVVSSKFRASRPQYLSSLALKLNMKLGGINHRLGGESVAWLHAAPTMVVGMNVLHPGPGSVPGTPSVAAIVASVDEHFAQYPATLSLQSGQENIMDLKMMMIERLKFYQNRNDGKLPERILVYRNGRSEALFNTLLSTEVPRIIDAFQLFDEPDKQYRPKLIIVTCRKSQRTWFWVDGAKGDGNPEAGTVVDRGVTSVYNFDFYLQAHGGGAGTARPTLYTVIYDETGARADEIQGATHALSYMYASATHAMSLAVPAHYAGLACKRGRCYLRKLWYGYGEMDELEEKVRGIGDIPGWGLSSTMFYI